MNPFLFIVGCPRSGTTLLQRIADAHPQIAVTPETHWIPSFYHRRTGLTADGRVTPSLIDALYRYRTFGRLRLGRADLERMVRSEVLISYAQFVSRVFDLYGQALGKPLVGDKTPGYARHVPFLHELWPGAKVVHLIRDGRDVCLSMNSWEKADKLAKQFATWREEPILTAALFWEQHVRLCRTAGRALGSALYYELRYEALVTDPAGEVGRLCTFLGVSYEDRMLRFHLGRTRPKSGLDAKHAWLPVTIGLRDWRSQMPPSAIERFEAAAGDLLEDLGYPVADRRPHSEKCVELSRFREAFAADFDLYSQRSSLSAS